MSNLESLTKPLMWFMALPLVAIMAGCSGSNPILGGGDINAVPVPPTVTAVAPANIATAVPINTKTITAAFSKAMTGTTINTASFLLECPAGTPVTGAVTYLAAGSVATLTLPASPNLPPSTVCKATVTTAAKDTTGLPMASNFVWTFTTGATPDTTLPRVALTVPATTTPGPTPNVPANTAITAVFTEDMAPATLASPATSFTLTCAGTPVTSPAACVTPSPTGTVSYTVASRIATYTLTPAGTVLEAGKTYTATIKGTGATPATDLAGNALAGSPAVPATASDYVWTFVAANPDITPPTITLENPADIATAVAINSTVNATFSEAMDLSSAVFTVRPSGPPLGTLVPGTWAYDPVSKIATFTPTSALASSTQYTATITGAKDLAGNPLSTVVSTVPPINKPNPWTFTTGSGLAPGAVPLGSAGTFGLMATAAVTSAGASVINGDVSLDPGTSITGFPPAVINGALHVNDTVSAQARSDLLAAYNFAKGLACATNVGTADLGGLYVYPTGIPPGVYCSGSTMLVGAHIVLDGGGNANAVWVFQIGSSLTTGADVTLTGGAQAKNVFWVPTADATIGSGTIFNGTIVTGANATSAGSATINGRILAGAITAGTIALNGPPSTVNVPAP